MLLIGNVIGPNKNGTYQVDRFGADRKAVTDGDYQSQYLNVKGERALIGEFPNS
jgi:hypothetical protein